MEMLWLTLWYCLASNERHRGQDRFSFKPYHIYALPATATPCAKTCTDHEGDCVWESLQFLFRIVDEEDQDVFEIQGQGYVSIYELPYEHPINQWEKYGFMMGWASTDVIKKTRSLAEALFVEPADYDTEVDYFSKHNYHDSSPRDEEFFLRLALALERLK